MTKNDATFIVRECSKRQGFNSRGELNAERAADNYRVVGVKKTPTNRSRSQAHLAVLGTSGHPRHT